MPAPKQPNQFQNFELPMLYQPVHNFDYGEPQEAPIDADKVNLPQPPVTEMGYNNKVKPIEDAPKET